MQWQEYPPCGGFLCRANAGIQEDLKRRLYKGLSEERQYDCLVDHAKDRVHFTDDSSSLKDVQDHCQRQCR